MSQSRPTPTQADAYAAEYLLNGIQRNAFRAAFPDSNCTDETADTKSSKMFKTSEVQASLSRLQAISSQLMEEKFSLSVEDIHKTLALVIKKGLRERLNGDGEMVPVSLSAVVSAAAEVNKMCGNHTPFKLEMSEKDVTPWSSVKAAIDE